ncbi:MAG: MinD/ParA family protein [Alphaproteobacteria bacterium]|nr:MinD/ParA family protein [Alphaproteobacteria bacterium]
MQEQEQQKQGESFFVSVPNKGKNIIAIASGHGGVGKTWFAITLAHALSLLRKKILLLDGALGMENIDVQLGLNPKYDLGNAIRCENSLNQIICNYDKGHFDIISGRSDAAGLASVPVGRLQILGEDLCSLASIYDKMILDIGAGLGKSVRILSGMAEQIIVVCTGEASSLTGSYAYIKLMQEQYPKSKIDVVVNQADGLFEGKRTFDLLLRACDEFLNFKPSLLGVVRRDTRVRDAIRNKMSVISRYPTSEAAEDVMKIAKRLINGG